MDARDVRSVLSDTSRRMSSALNELSSGMQKAEEDMGELRALSSAAIADNDRRAVEREKSILKRSGRQG